MSLRKECKQAILDALKKDGMPPIIDKTYDSIWSAFAKTQPSALSSQGNFQETHVYSITPTSAFASSTGQLVDSDVWGNLQKCLEKFGVDNKYATRVITAMKKKFGESPSQADIKAMMT
ncbi:hypothetical protein Fcan01_21496 [Folsomia candida]|uniref:Uncharacterized protein n=1 Tax=Folsomia candida TaxID=158441 RepID=A0A226DHC2_FOLCA|nr:hypothetical protein Fcan01_21496 [Folsomia candida]